MYRLITSEHVCPYGLKTIDLLKRRGVEIGDRHLETEEEATELRERLAVDTRPQTFIDGELVGTLDDVGEYFGEDVPDDDGETYRPAYLDDRELTCACAGGDSRVPLGFVSLTENLAMIAMAIWMGSKHLL